MYKAFYGLSEAPFSIAPNPRYLFLSDRHREALAHLTYGLGEGGGFVLLTGEVGTGKTTVARSLLQQLPENIQVASILNPTLTELELLATLCDELGIRYAQTPSLKQLTDVIREHLLANHRAGRQTLLLIDEAQHLRAEVLEQLRLLTNLETDQHKLLQVILIGQPELQQLLKQQHLRQLAQRITARYHLMPLDVDEVGAYVVHRLAIAGRATALFNKAAYRAIHRLSQGIPRVINLLCERALMAAYSQQHTEIAPALINQAAGEVLVIDVPVRDNTPEWRLPALMSLLSAVLGYFLVYALIAPGGLNRQAPSPMLPPQPITGTVQAPAGPDLAPFIERALRRQPAFSALMGLWGTTEGAGQDPCRSAERFGLRCFQGQGLDRLQGYDLPAVVELHHQGQGFYGVLVTMTPDHAILQLAEQRLRVSSQWLAQHWNGVFTLLWQPPEGFTHSLRLGDRNTAVETVDMMLNTLYQLPPRRVSQFDYRLEQNIRRFQSEQQLTIDGIVGSKTLLQLQAVYGRQGPRLITGES